MPKGQRVVWPTCRPLFAPIFIIVVVVGGIAWIPTIAPVGVVAAATAIVAVVVVVVEVASRRVVVAIVVVVASDSG